MPGSCCRPNPGPDFRADYDAVFDSRMANNDLNDYRRHGAGGTARRLVEAVKGAGVEGASLLDIGAGVGVIGQELLAAGASELTDVDASQAYLDAARWLADRRGVADRASFRHADFVAVADEVPPADVVTLDRVVCCYPDWHRLVSASSTHARRLYGLAYPVDRWWLRLGGRIGNLALGLFRYPFRFWVHPTRAIETQIREAGFERIYLHRGWIWQVALYERRHT
jgi:magnesium-protoporphyrin O-methyltransferase